MKELKDRGWAFSSIQKQHRRLKDSSELDRCVAYATSGGTKYMKFTVRSLSNLLSHLQPDTLFRSLIPPSSRNFIRLEPPLNLCMIETYRSGP